MARTARGRATRDAFREGARRVFAKSGYLGTTLADIANEAGRSPGLLYQHYDGKAEILADLTEELYQELQKKVKEPSRSDTPSIQALREALREFWLHYREHMGEMVGVSQAAIVDSDFATLRNQIRQEAIEIVARSILRAQREGYCPGLVEPMVAASALTLMVENFCYFWQHEGGVGGIAIDDETAVETLWNLWSHAIFWTEPYLPSAT